MTWLQSKLFWIVYRLFITCTRRSVLVRCSPSGRWLSSAGENAQFKGRDDNDLSPPLTLLVFGKHEMLVTERGTERLCNYTAELLAGSVLCAARKYHKLHDFHPFVRWKQRRWTTGRGCHNGSDLFRTQSLFLVNSKRSRSAGWGRCRGRKETTATFQENCLPCTQWKGRIALIKKCLFIEQKSLEVQECCFQSPLLLLSVSPSLLLSFFLSFPLLFLQPPLSPVG